MTLRTLNYGNYGIFLIMGHAGFCPSTVLRVSTRVPVRFPTKEFFGASKRVVSGGSGDLASKVISTLGLYVSLKRDTLGLTGYQE